MGLDISAYSEIQFVKSFDDDDDDDGKCSLYANPHFPTHSDRLVDGLYLFKQRMNFRAGSYSGYNEFRNKLCYAIHGMSQTDFWEKHRGKIGLKFGELINFSDCEGFIGPATSAKLAKDFQENEELFKEMLVKDYKEKTGLAEVGPDNYLIQWDLEAYAKWKAAFELAANTGAVCFH